MESLIFAAAIALLLRLFVLSPFKVENSDMAPVLMPGDYFLSLNLPFGFSLGGEKKIGGRQPRRQELIVVRLPGEEAYYDVKRVWAVAGDRFEIKKGQVFANEQLVPTQAPTKVQNYGPIVVPPNYIFVSNEAVTPDNASQGNGLVPLADLSGVVWKIWFSIDLQKTEGFFSSIRWERIFSSVH